MQRKGHSYRIGSGRTGVRSCTAHATTTMPIYPIPPNLQRKLQGPVDLVVLEDCYHLVTIDRQRDTVLARTADFVARISTSLGAHGGACAVKPLAA